MKPYETDYRLLRKIGEGGMGEVHLAEHLRLPRQVALKLLARGILKDSQLVDRFRREARLLATLDHPNVVHLFDARLDVEEPYIAFEYIPGAVALLDAIPEPGRTPQRSAAVVLGLFEGLAYLHGSGILHRDVKPANVLLDAGGTVRIIDFGLGRRLNADETRLTMDGQVMGTFAYMAPEQILGGPLDFRTDLYSATLVAVEVLAGRLIFGNPGGGPRIPPATRMAWGVNNLENLCPDLPRALLPHLGRLLQPAPADRPPDSSKFIETLRQVAAGTTGPDTAPVNPLKNVSVATTPRRSRNTTRVFAPPAPRPTAPPRHGRWFAALGIGLVAGVAGVAAFLPGRPVVIPRADSMPRVTDLEWRWSEDDLTVEFRTDRPCVVRLEGRDAPPPRSDHRIRSPREAAPDQAAPRLLADDRPLEFSDASFSTLAIFLTRELRARKPADILRAADRMRARNRSRGTPDAPIEVVPAGLVGRMASAAPWIRAVLGGSVPFDPTRLDLWNQIQESLAVEEWCRGQRIEAPALASRLLPREYRGSLHFLSNDEYRLLDPLKLEAPSGTRTVSLWHTEFTEQQARGPESWFLVLGGAVLVGYHAQKVFAEVASGHPPAGTSPLRAAVSLQIPASVAGAGSHAWLGYQPCAEKGTTGLVVTLPSGLKRRLPLAGPQALRYVKLPPWSLLGRAPMTFEVVPSPGLPDYEGCWFKGFKLILTQLPLPADVVPSFQ